jgi:hypothetical protein
MESRYSEIVGGILTHPAKLRLVVFIRNWQVGLVTPVNNTGILLFGAGFSHWYFEALRLNRVT